MFVKLPTPKGDYCVNLAKVIFFYARKDNTCFEMEDGTVIYFTIPLEEVISLIRNADCLFLV